MMTSSKMDASDWMTFLVSPPQLCSSSWTLRPSSSSKSSSLKTSRRSAIMTVNPLLYKDILWTFSMIYLMLSSLVMEVTHGKNFKCDYQKFPEGGCSDPLTTTCNPETDQCVCRSSYPVNVHGRCFAIRDVEDLCVTSRQCSKIKGKCFDNAGEEVVANDYPALDLNPSSPISPTVHELNTRMLVGVCKCPEGYFYHQDKGECTTRILGRKCHFNTDCFHRSHSFCDGSKCKCKQGFFQDFSNDECKPSIVALCMLGYVYENGTQKCRPTKTDVNGGSSFDGNRGHAPLSSSLSALFWPIIAFFLVILLLKMLKEGMRRDCERAAAAAGVSSGSSSEARSGRSRRNRSHGSHNRSINAAGRPYRHYPSDFLPSLGFASSASTSSLTRGLTSAPPTFVTSTGSNRNRSAEIIVLMPPPPYSATPNTTVDGVTVTTASSAITVEEPPSYEEATRK